MPEYFLSRALLDKVDESFCHNCPAISATHIPVYEEHCPADFEPGTAGCKKRDQYQTILDLLEEVEDLCKSA